MDVSALPSVSIVIPTYNCTQNLKECLSRIRQQDYPKEKIETLVVDGRSTDNTREEVKKEGTTLLEHKKRKGIGAALKTGMDYALKNNFDIIVVLAGNGKDNPKEIPRLLAPILKEDYDFVQGARYIRGGFRGQMPTHRLLFTRMYSWIVRMTTGSPVTDATNGFRAYKTHILKDKRINIHQD